MKSNFVLWCDGLDFYVTKRVGQKKDSEDRAHFVGFFETERAAYAKAIYVTKNRVLLLNSYVRYFKKAGNI